MVSKAMLGARAWVDAGVWDAAVDPDDGRFPTGVAEPPRSGEADEGCKIGFASGRGTPICGKPWLGPKFGAGLSFCPISAGLGAPVWAGSREAPAANNVSTPTPIANRLLIVRLPQPRTRSVF
jgi:hypothetical protein